jgi:hypothetical protein
MHMTGTLQLLIDANRIVIEAVSYEGKWGEVDLADDIDVYES